MNVMCICGSPRKKGNTAKALGWVEEALRKAGHRVDHCDIIDYQIKGCGECYGCKREGADLRCAVEDDDANALFARMGKADAVVYATPLFCWGFSGQLKPFIDRHFCLVMGYGTPDWRSAVQGKRLALLVTAAGPEDENADLIGTAFSRLCHYAMGREAGKLVLTGCTTPDALGETEKAKAAAFAARITA